jgi:hypothetical protein
MQNDYQGLAIEAIDLAKTLLAENKRLRLSIALMKFKHQRNKAGRKQVFSDEFVLAMIECFPEVQARYEDKGKKITQKEFVAHVLRKQFPKQNQYALSGKMKTIQNRMNAMRKIL